MATLISLLARAGRVLTLDQLMQQVLREAPNIALSLFCTHDGRPKLLELLQARREKQAVSPTELSQWFMARSRFQLKRQLIHVGLLAWEPAHGGAGADYDATRDVWRLRYS